MTRAQAVPVRGGAPGAEPLALSSVEARALTEEVKSGAQALWAKLLRLHQGGAHTALGYASWGAYCATEFGMSDGRAYQLLGAARVVEQLTTVSPALPSPENEAQARELVALKDDPEALAAAWTDAVAAGEEAGGVTAAHVREAVARREAKSHAQAHAERQVAHEALVAARAAPVTVETLYGRIVRAEALDYLRALPDGCVDVCVTSPPYWMKRTYTHDPRGLGQEPRPGDYVERLRGVVNEIGRVLSPKGALFLVLGDTYGSQPGQYRGDPDRVRGVSAQLVRANGTAPAGRELDVAPKSLCLVPERLVLRLVGEDGWRLANKIVWSKLGHPSENVYDRYPQGWDPVYLLTRAEHLYFNDDDALARMGGQGAAVAGVPGFMRTDDDVWPVAVGRRGRANGHLAPFPEALVAQALLRTVPRFGVVLDPFSGSGTVRDVAGRLGCRFLGCDLAGEPGRASPSKAPEGETTDAEED